MKNLYKYLAPFLADTFGFQEIMDVTDGMGILDDCSGYKGQVSRADRDEPYNGSRMVCSSIRMEDVIGGTKKRLLETFRNHYQALDPAFIMLSTAPVASMIGTDMEDVADTITGETGIPSAPVNLAGHKYYDHGISETLLAMAKLLASPSQEKLSNSINLLGGNAIDWTAKNVRGVSDWVNCAGFGIVSQWGGRETADNLKRASAAEVNLVTAMSGLAAAKWMEREFDIPYVAAVPFGRSWSKLVAQALTSREQPKLPEDEAPAKVLIVGEQLMSNAIRATLNLDYDIHGVDIATFFTFSKPLGSPKDKRVKSEDEFQSLLQNNGYSLIIGDPDLRVLAPKDCTWIDLPHGAICYEYTGVGIPLLAGEKLNDWLDRVLPDKEALL